MTEPQPLAAEDTLLRLYHVSKVKPLKRDFPTTAQFVDPEMSCDLLSDWGDEAALRAHINSRPRSHKDPTGPRRKDSEYGMAALSKVRVERELGLEVKPDRNPPEDPDNRAHHVVLCSDPDAASVKLYRIALGYSPPPEIANKANFLRCARWVQMASIAPD